MQAYAVPRTDAPIDVWLNANEGGVTSPSLLETVAHEDPDLLRRYPDSGALDRLLAERLEVEPERVIATSGSNDALDRACRTVLSPGREMIVPVPTFEMLIRYARLTGADIQPVPWLTGPFPAEAVCSSAGSRTTAVGVTSPNNPTGVVMTLGDLERLSRDLPGALIITDLAYIEFADVDLTRGALALPNVLVVRTLSKAWGLAGLRVGYAVGPAEIISWMRRAGQNYPLSSLSAVLAARKLAVGGKEVRAYVDRVRRERPILESILTDLGAEPFPSQANFVLARFHDATETFRSLAAAGIAVRIFPGTEGLEDCLRITCPGNRTQFDRLVNTLNTLRDRGPADVEVEMS